MPSKDLEAYTAEFVLAKPLDDLRKVNRTHDEFVEDLIFNAGLAEAAKRVLATETYCEKTLRTIFGIELESADE